MPAYDCVHRRCESELSVAAATLVVPFQPMMAATMNSLVLRGRFSPCGGALCTFSHDSYNAVCMAALASSLPAKLFGLTAEDLANAVRHVLSK